MKGFKKSWLAAVVALLAGSQLYAQPSTGAEPVAPAAAKGRLSISEMKVNSDTFVAQVRIDLQRVQHLQTIVRKEKDVIKLSCVNDKFVKLKAETNIFDSANSELLRVLDTDARFDAYANVQQAADATHKIREEAEACAGESELTPKESANSFDAPEIPDDPTQGGMPFPGEGGGSVEPPGYASPYN
jgi:hypothetical protein